MRQSIAIVSALAGVSFAQTQTLEFFFPGGYEGPDPVATIKEASPQTTALRLACPQGADETECGFGSGLDYTIISGTSIKGAMTAEGMFAMTMGCVQDIKADEVTCSASVSNLASISGITEDLNQEISTVLKFEDNVLTATVVEGADLLTASETGAPKSSSTGASAGSSASAPTASAGTSPTSSGASATGTVANATGSGAAPESTGAASRFGIAGSALLALAGAAALNAF